MNAVSFHPMETLTYYSLPSYRSVQARQAEDPYPEDLSPA